LNQHAIKINDLEKDLGKKVETTKLADTINMIGEGLGYFDNEFGRITKQMMGNYIYVSYEKDREGQKILNLHWTTVKIK
jgi:hypothetical protein